MLEDIDKIQDFPTVDSISTEPFEYLVEIYYQIKGFITSSNKWFWIFESGKQQRGYQDIDILAVNETETLIISVTSNLDDKIRFGRDNKLRKDMIENLDKYFSRVETYLKNVEEYAWLVKSDRKIRRVIAYAYGGYEEERRNKEIREELKKKGIELISSEEIIKDVKDTIKEMRKKGLKTNNYLVKMIQLWSEAERKTHTTE